MERSTSSQSTPNHATAQSGPAVGMSAQSAPTVTMACTIRMRCTLANFRGLERYSMPFYRHALEELAATLSPDGRWMGYVSDESGRQEVYVRAFPGMGARYQVSLDGGTEPVWSPRGGEIFYRNGPAMVVAAVRTNPGFEVLGRTTLFTNTGYVNSSGYEAVYDVAPDGQHLLMVRGLAVTSGMTLTLNWFENLRGGRVGGDTRAGEGAPQP